MYIGGIGNWLVVISQACPPTNSFQTISTSIIEIVFINRYFYNFTSVFFFFSLMNTCLVLYIAYAVSGGGRNKPL